MDDTVQDRAAVAPYVSQVAAYPLSEFTGEMRTMDWTTLPSFPAPATEGGGEVSWVAPQDFFGVLPQVLREVPPMAGEESIHELVDSVLAATESDAAVRQALDEAALEAERELITPLFDYSNEGVSVGHGWGTLVNSARFGADYVTRTSCAKANIFANRPEESAYFFTDVDASESRLTGDSSYTVTFGPDGTPPVQGFWSLTLYDEHHFFAPNDLDRFSLGTKNQDLQTNEDGSHPDLRSARVAGIGQGVELAAVTRRRVPAVPARRPARAGGAHRRVGSAAGAPHRLGSQARRLAATPRAGRS